MYNFIACYCLYHTIFLINIAIINKIKYVLRMDSISSLYTSIIEPHFAYCVEICGNAYKSNLNPPYVKHKRLIRLMIKSGYLDHTANLFQSLNVLLFFV